MSFALDEHDEWLEADGLGGFASGTATGVRTRRYHALLTCAQTPPTNRYVLVNGVEATLVTPAGEFPLTRQRYTPDVTTGGPEVTGAEIELFSIEPWPTWVLRLTDGTRVRHEIMVCKDSARTVVSWRLETRTEGVSIRVRPLISGRDLHALHHENDAFHFEPAAARETLTWTPYLSVPSIRVRHNGTYTHAPTWYRGFQYDQERERGFEFTEDLASPGTIEFDLSRDEAVMILEAEAVSAGARPTRAIVLPATQLATSLRDAERHRRERFASPLERAGDAYIVRRGQGSTIIAGYPWFGDWGRDTFIAVRGLCLAPGRLEEARAILLEWARHVAPGCDGLPGGLLPNRFPDKGEEPEYNSVDAGLWFIIAAHELAREAQSAGTRLNDADELALRTAIQSILAGYSQGTIHGIRLDDDGLLAAGEPGVQLTWMDARVEGRVITPRIGKPVEVQALWLNALRIGAMWAPRWMDPLEAGLATFAKRFWNEPEGCLFDVIDVDHVRGTSDATIRPNQALAAGGLGQSLLNAERTRRVVDRLERTLMTPMGPRSLDPAHSQYAGRYQGGPVQRDGVYHQGPVWPWLLGSFVEAWVKARGDTDQARGEARVRFFDPVLAHLGRAGLGHVSELADGDRPHTPRGCPFQAWSVGELIRLDRRVLSAREVQTRPVIVRRAARAAG
ncbi:MAG: amylo-alpha-1,6-glucosidase [Planctomycetota bacterium]